MTTPHESITAEGRINAHSGYVQTIGANGEGGHFGVCAHCVWMGPDREHRHEATADVQTHVAGTGRSFAEVLEAGRREGLV